VSAHCLSYHSGAGIGALSSAVLAVGVGTDAFSSTGFVVGDGTVAFDCAVNDMV
jgi:hypothetical protein